MEYNDYKYRNVYVSNKCLMSVIRLVINSLTFYANTLESWH